MKTISFRFIIATMAAVAVSVSCQKDPVSGTAGSRTDGVRVISVSFDHPTKATIDNLTPKFENNDKIRVSNATKSEECTISISGDNATFATSLKGELTAIYPSSAAILSTGAADAPIATSNNFKVPISQDGTARNAIIAKATIATESSSAFFIGQTVLFEIIPPSGTTSITITSLNTVEHHARTGTAVAINTEGATDADKLVINAAVPTGGKSYVSLLPGVKLSDLSFCVSSSSETKEIPVTVITAAGGSNITAANTKYTINSTGWETSDPGYVEIGGKKWATMNLGATTVAGSYETCAGDYYVWGSLNTIYDSISWSGTSGTFNFKSGFETGFYLGNPNLMEYTTPASLPDVRDVARQKLGDGWRMPTNADFLALYNACGGTGTTTALPSATPGKGIYWLDKNQSLISDYTGVAGLLFVDDAGKKLFFPAAGGGGLSTYTALNNVDEEGHYWSSIFFKAIMPYSLAFSNSLTVNPQSEDHSRVQGFTVRPVKDTVDYVDIGGQRWATKNLGATTEAGSLATCAGDYYAWGETDIYYTTLSWSGTTGTFGGWKAGKENGYAWKSYCNGSSSFVEWPALPYDNTSKVLTCDYDVVHKKLGESWRMPAMEEFQALYNACKNPSYDQTTYASTPCSSTDTFAKGVYWCDSYDGVAGCLFCDGTNKLFFPAAGAVNGTNLKYTTSTPSSDDRIAYYWASTLYTTESQARRMTFKSNGFGSDWAADRYLGFSVRPVMNIPVPGTSSRFNDAGDGGTY